MTPLDADFPIFFTWRDFAALSLFALCWFGATFAVETKRKKAPSTANIMAQYRRAWMREMLNREPRIMDSNLLGQLRSGAAFFASGCMIAIGGATAMLNQADRLVSLAQDLSSYIDITRAASEVKILFLILLLSSAFLRFVWSHRLFGYCAILMGAAGSSATDPDNQRIARKAGALCTSAGRSFNRGLRQVYFSLAALAWFLGPEAFAAATLATTATLIRREFFSESRRALLEE